MKRTITALVAGFLLFPGLLIFYRTTSLGYPLFPTAPGKTWTVSMDARVHRAGEEKITVSIGLPESRSGRTVLEEQTSGGSLEFNLLREGPNRFGVWSGSPGPDGETITYGATVLVRPLPSPEAPPPAADPYPEGVDSTEQALAERLALTWKPLPPPARVRALAAATAGDWTVSPSTKADSGYWETFRQKHGPLTAFLVLARAAELHARAVEGLLLWEGVTNDFHTWVEIWNGTDWQPVSPVSGKPYQKPGVLLPLTLGGVPAAQVVGGPPPQMLWSIRPRPMSHWDLHYNRIRRSTKWLDRWSLFSLPPEFQNTFRILLLVPVGSLVISVLRNIVGLPTFGIFMPILMAIAFRNTGLAYGLAVFWGVIVFGFAIRRGLDRLRLLLVPRLSVLLTLVIGALLVVALIGSHVGLRQFMAVGLLPIVILTMTIERFFVLVEESGSKNAFLTALGSAAVATLTYEILLWEPLQLTFFVYPELLSVVAAVQILIGRYTGFRLTEIFRFRALRRSP